MNMLLWTNHVTEEHYPLIEKLKATGFNGVEIPIGLGDKYYFNALGMSLKDMGMESTAVTSLSPEHNICSSDVKVRRAGKERLKWAIDMAYETDIKLICGPFHSAFALFSRRPPSLNERLWSIEVLQEVGDYAEQAKIMLAPEALNRFECYLYNTMEDLKWMLDKINHSHVGAIYDTHHCNIEEKSQKSAIETIAPYLKHVHISENDRGTPGSGSIDWKEVFTTLKAMEYDGWLTIEAFSTAIPEFANSINVWRDFSSIEEIYQKGYHFINNNWDA